jgi:hypothetical protein
MCAGLGKTETVTASRTSDVPVPPHSLFVARHDNESAAALDGKSPKDFVKCLFNVGPEHRAFVISASPCFNRLRRALEFDTDLLFRR